MKGKFVTFEGCEGSGKSTQIRLLSEKLKKAGIPHMVTREPGGSDIAEQIRGIILSGRNTAMCDECEALLYAAARAQHCAKRCSPRSRRACWCCATGTSIPRSPTRVTPAGWAPTSWPP